MSSFGFVTLDRCTFRNIKTAVTIYRQLLVRNCTFAGNKIDISIGLNGGTVYTDTKVANLSVMPSRGPKVTKLEARARVMPLARAPLNNFLQANDTAFGNLRKVRQGLTCRRNAVYFVC